MSTFKALFALLGRVSLSLLFLWAGSTKLMDWQGATLYMASKHMPLTSFFLPMAVLIQFLGGLSLLLGYKTRYGALLLIIFIIPASIIFHDFWNLTGSEQYIEKIIFMKDLGVLGGLLQIMAFGAGKYALDREITYKSPTSRASNLSS